MPSNVAAHPPWPYPVYLHAHLDPFADRGRVERLS